VLYGRGKSSYRFLAKLFKVSPPAVQKWIKSAADRVPEPEVDPGLKEVEFDEMWHFLDKKKKIWVWMAIERTENKTVGWLVGDRSAKTFEKFFKRFRQLEHTFFTRTTTMSTKKLYPQKPMSSEKRTQ